MIYTMNGMQKTHCGACPKKSESARLQVTEPTPRGASLAQTITRKQRNKTSQSQATPGRAFSVTQVSTHPSRPPALNPPPPATQTHPEFTFPFDNFQNLATRRRGGGGSRPDTLCCLWFRTYHRGFHVCDVSGGPTLFTGSRCVGRTHPVVYSFNVITVARLTERPVSIAIAPPFVLTARLLYARSGPDLRTVPVDTDDRRKT